MIDRELLERAARAFGIELVWSSDPGWAPKIKGRVMVSWNPLDDDGDALRLAVKLHLVVKSNDVLAMAAPHHMVGGDSYAHGVRYTEFASDHAGDENAATRRAIVRAAAALAGEAP